MKMRSLLSVTSTAALAAVVALVAAPTAAHAQPTTRGNPVIKTPPRLPLGGKPPPGGPTPPVGPAPGGAAPAPGGGAPGGTGPGGAKPGPGGQPGPGQAVPPGGANPDDPMSNVKQGVKEIEFKPKGGNFLVSFNLDDADLPELVKAISNITGKRFIYGGKLRQIKATVYSPEKVTAAEAYSAFLSILETNGMTVIPHGRFLKIIETPGVVQQTTPIVGTATPVPAEDRYVTRLYRMSNVDATEAANVLNKFKTKDGDITVYPPGNLLIITDTGSNIQRMLRIVEDVDVGGAGDQLWLEPVHYGSASEVATKLNEILDLKGGGGKGAAGKGGGGGGAGGARIVADDHTNSLVITASQPDYLRLLELIKRMDVPQTGEGEIHVLPLQHAGCKELSATLNQILGSAATASAAGGAGGARPGGAARPAGPATPGAAEDIFEGQVRVTCDEATNSLVTTSSLRDYAQLRGVIDKLDMPRRQVFIEAVIMDVSVSRSTDFGLGYHAGTAFDVSGKQAILYGGNNPLPSIAGVPQNLEALALGLRGPEIDGTQNLFGTGLSIPAFGVVMHALAKDGNTNVLATPHILATDNIKAEISIGQNIPLQTNIGGAASALGALAGQAGQAGGAAGALGGLLGGGGFGFSAPRQDVGTKVTVTPHVNDSDQVRLELAEEISEAGDSAGTLGAVSINKRTASTTLIVRDQQTVVIGGLVRDFVVNNEKKIPVLGDIPVLGVLFRQSTRSTQKSNLLLVLTPYVIRDQDDLRAIFERKMQERQEFIDRYFVFNENTAWQPPRDFSRSNGLVEDIRQSILAVEEKQRLEEEAKPKGKRTHEPGEPIALPSLGGGRGGGRDDGDNTPPVTNTGGPVTPGTAPAPGMGGGRKIKVPGSTTTPTPTPRPVERVE